MVAQLESNPTKKNDMTSYYHNKLVLDRVFILAAGDFIIREIAHVAPDRPWSTRYELKVVREDERTMEIWPITSWLMGVGGNVVLRIRMTNPPSEDLHAAVLELHNNLRSEIRNRMINHFVPIYLCGFLCVGETGK